MREQLQISMEKPAIRLEIVPEDEQQQELGDVSETSQILIDYLTRNGCTVTPVYTGKMGGSIYDILVHTYHIVHDNEELLAAMFASLAATLKLISDHKKPATSEKTLLTSAPMPVEIDLPTIDGPLTIKASNAEDGIKLIEQFRDTQPEKLKKVNPYSRSAIKVTIPRQKWRR